MPDLEKLLNLDDVEKAARRRLPKPIYDGIAGGASSESTVRDNRAALERYRLRPRVLTGAASDDLGTTLLGQHVSLPVLPAPTGFQRMAHRDAELATARGAGRVGTAFALSTATSFPLEDVAEVATGPKWFQLYLPGSRDAGKELVSRADKAGYDALVVTVDTSMHSIRERDVRNKITRPLKMHPKMLAHCAIRPRWGLDFLRGGVANGLVPNSRTPMSVKESGRLLARIGMPVEYSDIQWIRAAWPRKLIIKGVLRADDCEKLIDLGVDGFIVSNHGGRQLDGAIAAIDALAEIAPVIGDRAEILVDGGIRRGSDVLKALALGARAVLIGRPILFGLAVGGEAGVVRVLEILRTELKIAMSLLGAASVEEVQRDHVTRI